ncbi:restriction endonuclease subunit S [Phascolarctobacterium succinatutens]|uniref:restriction endonuclease subunit S n=1 Tax=Phascolarctobacterium succinatutens TaxID=626940 RepID=UPI0026EF5C97|nr:restriction endonuclease subunit S [Phascolarctobacterium succinatutens]
MPKKKTALTIEERLQQALVPAEEQPYEVPENWVWVRLGAVCGFERGITFPSSAKQNERDDENIPCLRTANVQDELELNDLIYVNKKYYKNNIDKLIRENDIIMSTANSRELVGKTSFVYKVEYPMIFGGFVMALRTNKLLSKFLFYYLRLEFLLGRFRGESTQTTNIANISSSVLGEYTFPLPPLSEQQRIVERIEELFAKLDEAKERLQEVADSFAVRKAAILHKAFTGELIGKQVTELVPLENLVDLIKIGPFGSSLHESDYIENGIPLVNPKHIVQQRIVPQSKISISDEKAEELSSYKLKENDIVLGRRGEMGRCAPISNREENWICGTGSMIIRLKKEYDAKLYSLILGSQATVTYLENSAVGSTLKNLNEKIVRKIPVPQFSSEEQHEIVRLIDDLLARERAAQQAAEQALASIDLMKKASLARAFRGELGTNKASEASALELLKQVLAEN